MGATITAPQTADRHRRFDRSARDLAIFLLSVAVLFGPILMAVDANDRLSSRCDPVADAAEVTYDRSSWWPLAWSCTVVTSSGESHTISAWDTLW